MPMKRWLYPDEWERIATEVKETADWRCDMCDVQCYRPGERVETRRLVLTVAHLNHTPADCRTENLMAMCAPCHCRYDAPEKARRRRERRRVTRGQLALEVEL